MGRYWQKHPKKDGEDALAEFDELGWQIVDPPKYYTVKCPCGEHMTHLHITPSNPNHWKGTLEVGEAPTLYAQDRRGGLRDE